VPLVGGRSWGLIEIYGANGRTFGREDATRAAAIADAAATLLERLQPDA
jgi:hypothetical protein